MNLVHCGGIVRCDRATLFSAFILSLRSKSLESRASGSNPSALVAGSSPVFNSVATLQTA
jgi:hypothetical protein